MCYENDSEWCASIDDEEMVVCRWPTLCDDCGHKISVGEKMREVTKVECEECQKCGKYYSRQPGRCIDPFDDCEWEAHDFGEQYHGNICLGCCRVRDAIQAIEEARGCPEGSRVPPYGSLAEDVDRGSLAEIVQASPELLNVPWVQEKLAFGA